MSLNASATGSANESVTVSARALRTILVCTWANASLIVFSSTSANMSANTSQEKIESFVQRANNFRLR